MMDICEKKSSNSVEKITEKTKLLKNPIKNYGVRSNIDVECGGGDGEATRLDRENLRNKNGVNIGILLLFSLLIGGVTIGVYLLSQQDKPWPINYPFDLVYREYWGSVDTPRGPVIINNSMNVQNLFIFQTEGAHCLNQDSCITLIRELQRNYTINGDIDQPFNFLIGGDGQTYEGRGWSYQSGFDSLPDRNSSLAIAFIGHFTNEKQPPRQQIEEAKALINESIRRKKLSADYRIFGVSRDNEVRGEAAERNGLFLQFSLWHKWKYVISLDKDKKS